MLHTLTYHVREAVPFINWHYFFHLWQIPANLVPAIVNGNDVAEDHDGRHLLLVQEGRRLYQEALAMVGEFDDKYEIRCRVGLYDASSEGDDILIFDEERTMLLPCLRQQHPATADNPDLCLSDFIRPAGSGPKDRLGVFATAVPQEMEDSYADDSYLSLMARAVSDRLAEAATEMAHLKVRRELWGYAPGEDLPVVALLAEKFQGIRPAVGYPSLPDQSVNFILNDLIDMGVIGIRVTENGAMRPHAAVSGLMIAHPAARYFAVGKIGEDQFRDYSRRRGLPEKRMKQFLTSNISF